MRPLVIVAALLMLIAHGVHSLSVTFSDILKSKCTVAHTNNSKVCCPGVEGNENLQKIIVSLFGSPIDPALYLLSYDDFKFVSEGTATSNNNCLPNAAGYNPPIPEYFVAIYNKIAEINGNDEILPNHLICLAPRIIETVTEAIAMLLTDAYDNSIIAVMNNMAHFISDFADTIADPFSLPLIRSGLIWNLTAEEIREGINSGYRIDSTQFSLDPNPVLVFKAIMVLAEDIGWQRIGILISSSGNFNTDSNSTHIMKGENYEVYLSILNPADYLVSFQIFVEKEIRIFVFYGEPSVYLQVMKFSSEHNFVGDRYVWIYAYNGFVFPSDYINLWCSYENEDLHVMKKALTGTLSVGLSEGYGSNFDAYVDDFGTSAQSLLDDTEDYDLNRRFIHTAYSTDMVSMVAESLHSIVQKDAVNMRNVSKVSIDRNLFQNILYNTNIEGLTGQIAYDRSKHRRRVVFVVRNFIGNSSSNFTISNSHVVDPWYVERRAYIFVELINSSLRHFNGGLVFANGLTSPPSDRPLKFKRNLAIILGLQLPSVTIYIVAVAIYLGIIAYKDYQTILFDESWLYKRENIQTNFDNGIRGRLRSNKNVQIPSKLNKNGNIKVGIINGNFVFFQKIIFDKPALTQAVRKEVIFLREFKHPNICPFIGCVLGRCSAILFEFCSRGSLHDLLTSQDFNLDLLFHLSFSLDIAKGMDYLHSKKIIHGKLSPKSCVVNTRWTLKITDYGLQSLRKCDESKRIKSVSRRLKNYVAPEISLMGGQPSFASDVYSYGHILRDLANCKNISKESTSFTLQEYNEDTLPQFVILMKKCVDSNPLSRPTFEKIMRTLVMVLPQLCDLNDSEFGVLDAYTNNLEALVDEISQNLIIEKENQHNMMSYYIPRLIVDSIRNGKDIPVQLYLNTSLICVELSNAENLLYQQNLINVCSMISSLQVMIDKIAEKYNIQKIHSTGPSWILACGIYNDVLMHSPTHKAAEIAVKILHKFEYFDEVSGHSPAVKISIHTGSLLCGVLNQGIAPQHIVAGSTIQTALQIMFSCQEMKIYISKESAQKLETSTMFRTNFVRDIQLFNGDKLPVFELEKLPESSVETDSSRPSTDSPEPIEIMATNTGGYEETERMSSAVTDTTYLSPSPPHLSMCERIYI